MWNCSKVAGTSHPRRRGVELFPGAGDFERGDELVESRPQFSIVGLRFDRRKGGGGGIVEKSALQVDGVVRRGGCAASCAVSAGGAATRRMRPCETMSKDEGSPRAALEMDHW